MLLSHVQKLAKAILLQGSMICFVGCATTHDAQPVISPTRLSQSRAIVGAWDGEIYKPDRGYLLKWEHQIKPDGTYYDVFVRVYPDGHEETKTEAGQWRLEKNDYTEQIPGMRSPDRYEVLMLTDSYFVIRMVQSDASTLTTGAGTIYIHKRRHSRK